MKTYVVRVTDATGSTWTVMPDNGERLEALGRDRVRLRTRDGRAVEAQIIADRSLPDGRRMIDVVVDGWRFDLIVEDEARAALRERARRGSTDASHAGRYDVRSVIPGRVVAVDVVEGAIVASGERLMIVEAMKMQNEIRAPRDGTVVRVAVGPGGTVEIGSVLVVLG
jgi:biotin carboxyl carrier protein